MSDNYTSDAERSVLKPAGPYWIKRSFDSVAQRHHVIRPMVVRPTSAANTIVLPAVRSPLRPSSR
jgi:hypothetical protein